MDRKTPEDTPGKYDSDYLEEKDAGVEVSPPGAFLSEPHKSYLIQRHGTLDLDPIPSMDPADPYNWASWKVSFIILPGPSHTNADQWKENCKPSPRCVPCVHGNLHCSGHHLCLREHRRRSRSHDPTSELSYFTANCGFGRSTAFLEATFTSFWATPDFPPILAVQRGVQRRMRKEYRLRVYGGLSSLGCILHLAGNGYW